MAKHAPKQKQSKTSATYMDRWRDDAEFRAAEIAKARSHLTTLTKQSKRREKYYADPKKFNERRTKWSQENKERQLANQRASYHRNREEYLAREIERRKKRNPLHGLFDAIFECAAGRISVDELARLYDEAIARVDDLYRERTSQRAKRECGL